MKVSRSTSDFAPLNEAFRRIAQRLERDGASRVLVATETMQKFKRRKLAPHNIVTRCPFVGERVAMRGRKRIDQSRLVTARWPEDHLHEVSEPALHFILSGQADMRVADYSVHCQPGDAIYIPTGLPRSDGSTPDYIESTAQSSCDALLLSPGLAAGFGLECSMTHSRGTKRIHGSADERCWVKNTLIAQLYYGICNELDRKGNTKSTFHLLLALLAQLREEIETQNALPAWPHSLPSTSQARQIFIRRALEYINGNLEQPLTINIVARQVGVSRTVLTREFRREVGDSLRSYLIKRRVTLAESLLKEANLPVKKVAKEVGLSPDRLRQLFHEKYGESPDKFRTSEK